jgi:hypothetical protein
MSKTFRAWKIDEPLFLSATVGDFVAKDHLARFVLSLVRDDLALAEITGTYGSERGMGRDEETGCQVEQRNRTQSCGSRDLTAKRPRGFIPLSPGSPPPKADN